MDIISLDVGLSQELVSLLIHYSVMMKIAFPALLTSSILFNSYQRLSLNPHKDLSYPSILQRQKSWP